MQSVFTLVTDEIKYENRRVKEKERITAKRRQQGVKARKSPEDTLKAISNARATLLSEGKKQLYVQFQNLQDFLNQLSQTI